MDKIMRAAQPLLALIRKHESKGNYNTVYHKAVTRPPKPLVKMTLGEILDWQRDTVRAGSRSSAAGAYQFIGKTLRATAQDMRLPLTTVWTPEVQDQMAVHLLLKRGFERYLTGKMDENAFLLELSKEWASLPRPDTGRSYYDGDGLNAALVQVDVVRAAARKARSIYSGRFSVVVVAPNADAAAGGAAATAAAAAAAAAASGNGSITAAIAGVAALVAVAALVWWIARRRRK